MSKYQISLPKLYPIIDSSLVSFDNIAEVTNAIISGGAKILQFRAKGLSSKEFLKMAAIISKITKERDVIFIVNDRVDIALLVNADGVHLGQDDLPVRTARDLLGSSKIIGYSTHNTREVLGALKLPINYISFGPIFPTKTKETIEIPKGIKGLSEVRKLIDKIPIVAIGGITESNMISVLKEVADSAAIISDILTSSNISQKIHKLNSIIENHHKN